MTTSSPLVYNVKDYSAVGDGSTDDTAHITSALTAAAASGSTTAVVYFPDGVYMVSQLSIPTGVVLQGVQSSAYGNAQNMDAPPYPASVLKQLGSQNKDMILCAIGANYQRFYDLGFDGNKSLNTTGGRGLVVVDDPSGSNEAQQIIERCFFFNFYDSGIYLGQHRRAVKVINCVSNYSAAGDGITVTNSDSTIMGCIIGSNFRAGINLGSTDSLRWSHFGNNVACGVTHVFNNDIYSNKVGINVGSGSWGNMIMGNGIDRHHNEGVAVWSGYNTSIQMNTFHSNGIDTDNTYPHVGLGSGVSQVAISGNDFGPQDGDESNKASYCVFRSGGISGQVIGDYGCADPSTTSVSNHLHN